MAEREREAKRNDEETMWIKVKCEILKMAVSHWKKQNRSIPD